jgi:phosphoribosyl 1,2-cyclic phosphate phosphodiesterase
MGAPLPLYAMPETMATLRQAFGYAFQPPLDKNRAYKDAIYRPELEPVEITGPFELFGRTWQPIDLPHGRFRVLGFRIGNFAYCTDCNDIPPESQEKLQGLDVLIIDALRARPHPTHLTFEQAAAMARTLGAKQTYFTHVAHDVKHADIEAALPPEVRVGFDGMKVVVNDK